MVGNDWARVLCGCSYPLAQDSRQSKARRCWTVGRNELLDLKNRRRLDPQLSPESVESVESVESDKLTTFKLQRIFRALLPSHDTRAAHPNFAIITLMRSLGPALRFGRCLMGQKHEEIWCLRHAGVFLLFCAGLQGPATPTQPASPRI